MSGPVPDDGVRRSVLGWLQRLGWNPLAGDQLSALRDPHGSGLLVNRLLPWLRRHRFIWHDQHVLLSPDSLTQIIDRVEDCARLPDWRSASNAVLHLLRDGVASRQTLPDGTDTTVYVPLVDWTHLRRNHWDVCDAVQEPQPGGAARVGELVGYVNGLPLVVLACVERDGQGRWGTTADGIERLWRGMTSTSANPPPLQTQLLLSMDRRGGRYATVGTPRHAWVRWREHGWDPAVQAQLRATTVPFAADPLHAPRAAHAELLNGLLDPGRLLQVLRGYVEVGTGGVRHVARSVQFFAVQHALQGLRTRDADGRRRDGQLCLAAGAGLAQTRHWLLRAIANDPLLPALRVLVPVMRSTPAALDRPRGRHAPSPAQQLIEFLAGGAPASLEVPLPALRGWARRNGQPLPSDDLVVLVDADFWESDAITLRRVRRWLPDAVWLTLAATPIAATAADLDPGTRLFEYPPAQAIEDGVVVPVWRDSSIAAGIPGRVARARTTRMAMAIGQHFHRFIRLAERDLRAVLLVAGAAQAQDYQQAFEADGQLRVQVIEFDGYGLPKDRSCSAAPPEVELIITYGKLPTARDPRLALLYVDRHLEGAERLRAVGLTTAPHPDKHASLLMDIHTGAAESEPTPLAHSLSAWLPQAVAADLHVLSAQRRRLHALLPDGASDDFHACCDHMAPNWSLSRHGGDIDLHRRRRDLLHVRVTAFGQRLQVATSSEMTFRGGQAAQLGTQYRGDLHRYSLLRDAASRDAVELGRYRAEDVRVRHWAREQAPQLREHAADYQVLHAIERPVISVTQRANQLYTQLRLRLHDPAEEPRLVETGRRALHQVLADCAGPDARLQALTVLASSLQCPPRDVADGQACSRGALLLEGVLDATWDQARHMPLGMHIDALVASLRLTLPDLPHVFRAEIREQLPCLLQGHLDQSQVDAVVEAVLARGPYWHRVN